MCVSLELCNGLVGRTIAVQLTGNYYRGVLEKVDGNCLILRLMNGEQAIISIPEIQAIRVVRA